MARSAPGVLICRSPNDVHDSDYVREQLLPLLHEVGVEDVDVLADYGDVQAIEVARFAVSYIAQRDPGPDEVAALRRLLERGGRWFAIHTSSAVGDGCELPAVLGSRFVSHPPYGPFRVSVVAPADPLLAGFDDFEVEDELYVLDYAGDAEVLLQATRGGEGLRGRRFEVATRPLMYRRRVGAGEAVYLALGHCNAAGSEAPERRGSWQSPVFLEIVRRCLAWAARVE